MKNKQEYSHSEVLNAESLLTEWRILHENIMTEFYEIASKEAKEIDSVSTIVQRVKRSESIIGKLKRHSTTKLTTMQDIAGIRVIMTSLNGVETLRERLKGVAQPHKFKSYDNYITNPKESGYRGVHLVYKYANSPNPILNGLMIEIQLRTELQHSWATAVETMSTFLGTHLKFGEGQPKWLKYFALTSSAFSILEGTPRVPGYEDLSTKETFQQAIYEFRYNQIEENLSAFTRAADFIVKKRTPNKFYHLLTLNITNRRVNVKSFEKGEFQKVNEEYTIAERKFKKTTEVQVVLVSTESIKELQSAFPNYFLDIGEFLNNMTKIRMRYNRNELPRGRAVGVSKQT